MNTRADAISHAPAAPKAAPPIISPLRLYLWSVRRELWENRYLYIAPLGVGALILIAFTVGQVWKDPHGIVDEQPYTFAALLLMLTGILAAMFYSLDALYGERRDRSVLFWKSLPVSDLTAVLAKATIPMVVVPVVTWGVSMATQAMMLLVASLRLIGSGDSVWAHLSFGQMAWILFYHLLLGHGLWYAPIWGWLLLCSAWSRRAPYLWATLPLLVVGLIEKIGFGTAHFGHWIMYRFGGNPAGMNTTPSASHHAPSEATMAGLTPPFHSFITGTGLWTGLVLCAVLLAITVAVRRRQGPM
jgi:ABC-2 type transport system permease protein